MTDEFAEVVQTGVEPSQALEADDVEIDDVVIDAASEPVVSHVRPLETGDPRVDDAIALLDDLDGLPTPDHVGVFDDVQRRLQSALTHSDADPGTGS
jgi:hypothetical protein